MRIQVSTGRLASLAAALTLAVASVAAASAPKASGKIPVTTSSDEARDLYLKGRDLFEKLRAPDARPLFEQAVAKDPDFALAHLALANSANTARDFFASLDKAVAAAGKASEGERLLIQAAQAGARNQAAEQKKLLEKLVKLYPGDERAQMQLGLWRFGQQDYAGAASAMQKAIAINPEFSQPYNQVGYVYRFMERYDDAAKAFEKYVELIPGDPNPYNSYAELLMKMGKLDESIRSYQKALSIDPNFIASYIGIGNDQIFQGKHDDARQTFAKLTAVARNPAEKRQAMLWTAVSYVDQGDTDKALAEVAKMRALDEAEQDYANLAGAMNFTGDILVEAGRADEAVTWYDQQLATVDRSTSPPEQKEAAKRNVLYDRTRVALAKNDVAGARKLAADYEKQVAAKNTRFQTQRVHELRGRIALAEKRYAAAVTELGKANPQDPRALYLLAQAQQGKGDAAAARKTATRVAEFNGLAPNYAFVRTRARGLLASR